MEPALKQRLIGAVVISALAIVFLPKLIVGHDKDSPAADVSLQLPGAPDRNFETRELPLTTPGSTPPGGVVGMNTNAPPLPNPAATPVPNNPNGNPLPVDPNAPAASATVGANGATTLSTALPTTQNALPTTAAIATTPAPATSPAAAATPIAAAQSNPPIPAARAGGNYVVSAGTYSNTANAQSLVNSLKAAQLPAYMEPVTANGKPGMRVRIGPFAQRGDAEAARLHAQQVRTDMTASVTALETAVEAPAAAFNSAAGKPVVPAATAPAAAKPAAGKPVAPTAATVAAPVAPAPRTAATGKPAAANPAATAASPAAAGRGYVVQVSAFSTEEEALSLRNRLRAAGFTAFSERVQLDSGTLYRVRVGPTADRDAADQLRVSLSQKLGLSGMVVAYP